MFISQDHPLMPYTVIKDNGKVLKNVAFANTDTGRVKIVDPDKQTITVFTSKKLSVSISLTAEIVREITEKYGPGIWEGRESCVEHDQLTFNFGE